MSRQEIELDIAAVIHSGRQYNADPLALARIIYDHLELMGLLEEVE